MIRLGNIKAPLDYDGKALFRLARERLKGVRVTSVRIAKKSVDARDRGNVHFVLTLDAGVSGDEDDILSRLPRSVQAVKAPEAPALRAMPEAAFEKRPVVVGLGPAGLFAAYTLALSGARPIVVERGQDVDNRKRTVGAFWAGGPLNPECNVQFGEGGAGAFSDGKLNTGISDPRCAFVLQTLYECGAPEEILYMARPHVGTDRLPAVVRTLRERIISLGGEVRFETRLQTLEIQENRVTGAVAVHRGVSETIDTDRVILAVGHSARDTFEELHRLGVHMIRKPFSVGARIEHLQRDIDLAQYGRFAGHPALGAADYHLKVTAPDGRGVYSFCMCPGGQVVAAASELGGVVTNGMSAFARDGKNANSALLVSVNPEDFGGDDPLAGVRFQRKWEQAAYHLTGSFKAPAQTVGAFLKGQVNASFGKVEPSYAPGVEARDLAKCLPDFVARDMKWAIERLERYLKGFSDPDAVLTGVETRSSSPLRIQRDENCVSSVRGLYPCGEGAGYAGGILSAAVDGIRVAEAAMRR